MSTASPLRTPSWTTLAIAGGPRDRDEDEPSAHLFGLRAAFLTAADEDADDITLEDIARSIKICRAEMGRRGLS